MNGEDREILRFIAAGFALQGLLANPKLPDKIHKQAVAREATEFGDALVAEQERTAPKDEEGK